MRGVRLYVLGAILAMSAAASIAGNDSTGGYVVVDRSSISPQGTGMSGLLAPLKNKEIYTSCRVNSENGFPLLLEAWTKVDSDGRMWVRQRSQHLSPQIVAACNAVRKPYLAYSDTGYRLGTSTASNRMTEGVVTSSASFSGGSRSYYCTDSSHDYPSMNGQDLMRGVAVYINNYNCATSPWPHI